MKKILTAIILTLTIVVFFSRNNSPLKAQSNENTENVSINWISIQELSKMVQQRNWKKKKKKVLVDLYTSWCGWCKRMDATTYQNPDIINYINEHYYAVRFNAEMRDSIEFGGKMYHYKKAPNARRGTHELAVALGSVNGRMGYPTTVFMNEDMQLLQALPGFKDSKSMLPILVYFGEDYAKSTPWSDFIKAYPNNKQTNN